MSNILYDEFHFIKKGQQLFENIFEKDQQDAKNRGTGIFVLISFVA